MCTDGLANKGLGSLDGKQVYTYMYTPHEVDTVYQIPMNLPW